MAENKSIWKAFSDFSKKFERFQKSENSTRIDSNQNLNLQNLINENENSKKTAVLNSFKNYEIPYTKEIEEDENSLLKAYEIFKATLEINKKFADEKTFLMDFKLASPITKKANYIYGGEFIYLQLWFRLCKKIKDFVPILKKVSFDFADKISDEKKLGEKSAENFVLSFVSSDDFEFDSKQKEIVQIVLEGI